MGSAELRKKGGQGGDAYKRKKAATPPMFQGFVMLQREAEVSLSEQAAKRVRSAWETGGAELAYLQEQVEWARHWIASGELAPKDALTAMRGIAKSLAEIEARASTGSGEVTVVLGSPSELSTGDALQVH